MEKPIITCDSVGCREVVNDTKNGYLVEPKNISDLVLKMEKMFRLSSDERKLMGKFGRKMMIKEFDENIVITKYLNVINQIF